jgi:hypothetical protein
MRSFEWVEDEELIRSYLLGSVSSYDRARVEIRIMLSRDYAEGVEIIEDELIDEYVAGELVGVDLARFVGLFMLHPGRLFKVRFARALAAYVQRAAAAS